MRKFEKAAVIGAGAWGTSLAIILSNNVKDVYVWAREKEVVESVKKDSVNALFLPDIKIPKNVKFTNDSGLALENAELVVWVVPIHFLASVAETFSPFVMRDSVHINAGKGIEIKTWKRPSQILKEKLKKSHSFGSIMGPNIAYEVANGGYAEAVVALNDFSDAEAVAKIFSTKTFKVRPSNDVVGVEIGAALKNIVALAAGFCDGMKLGANTKSIIMARGFQEIYKAASSLGAWGDSFIKESAILGDVLTTCMSPDSRNRSTGERLGEGMTVEESKKMLNGRVCAGLETIQICKMLEQLHGVELPIMSSLCELSEGKIDRKTCIDKMLRA